MTCPIHIGHAIAQDLGHDEIPDSLFIGDNDRQWSKAVEHSKQSCASEAARERERERSRVSRPIAFPSRKSIIHQRLHRLTALPCVPWQVLSHIRMVNKKERWVPGTFRERYQSRCVRDVVPRAIRTFHYPSVTIALLYPPHFFPGEPLLPRERCRVLQIVPPSARSALWLPRRTATIRISEATSSLRLFSVCLECSKSAGDCVTEHGHS